MAKEVIERWRRSTVDSRHDKDIEVALKEGGRAGLSFFCFVLFFFFRSHTHTHTCRRQLTVTSSSFFLPPPAALARAFPAGLPVAAYQAPKVDKKKKRGRRNRVIARG